MNILSDNAEIYQKVKELLLSSDPVFLGRFGGSDTNAVVALHKALTENVLDKWESLSMHRDITERFNGFYDVSGKDETFYRYLEYMLENYKKLSHAFFCNRQLLSIYFPRVRTH